MLTVLNAAVAAFYYLRVVVYMYMRDAAGSARRRSASAAATPGSALGSRLCAPIAIGLVPPVTVAVIELPQRTHARALL